MCPRECHPPSSDLTLHACVFRCCSSLLAWQGLQRSAILISAGVASSAGSTSTLSSLTAAPQSVQCMHGKWMSCAPTCAASRGKARLEHTAHNTITATELRGSTALAEDAEADRGPAEEFEAGARPEAEELEGPDVAESDASAGPLFDRDASCAVTNASDGRRCAVEDRRPGDGRAEAETEELDTAACVAPALGKLRLARAVAATAARLPSSRRGPTDGTRCSVGGRDAGDDAEADWGMGKTVTAEPAVGDSIGGGGGGGSSSESSSAYTDRCVWNTSADAAAVAAGGGGGDGVCDGAACRARSLGSMRRSSSSSSSSADDVSGSDPRGLGGASECESAACVSLRSASGRRVLTVVLTRMR